MSSFLVPDLTLHLAGKQAAGWRLGSDGVAPLRLCQQKPRRCTPNSEALAASERGDGPGMSRPHPHGGVIMPLGISVQQAGEVALRAAARLDEQVPGLRDFACVKVK